MRADDRERRASESSAHACTSIVIFSVMTNTSTGPRAICVAIIRARCRGGDVWPDSAARLASLTVCRQETTEDGPAHGWEERPSAAAEAEALQPDLTSGWY